MFVPTEWPFTQYGSILSELEANAHFSNFPVFHHSNWGKAPNLSSTCYNNTDLNKKKAGTNGGIKI